MERHPRSNKMNTRLRANIGQIKRAKCTNCVNRKSRKERYAGASKKAKLKNKQNENNPLTLNKALDKLQTQKLTSNPPKHYNALANYNQTRKQSHLLEAMATNTGSKRTRQTGEPQFDPREEAQKPTKKARPTTLPKPVAPGQTQVPGPKTKDVGPEPELSLIHI